MDTLEIAAKMVRDAVGAISTKFSALVKDEINTKVSSLYKPGGSATLATLPALTAENSGYVYDMAEAFTTTANFREGAGHTYPAGTNVVVSDVGGDTYKYDVLSGMLDGYVKDTRKVGNVPLSADIPVSLTGDTAITVTNMGTASAIGYGIAHNDSGVTAGSKGDATNRTPEFGGTFKTLSATVDTKGHVTSLAEYTVKVPDTTATAQANGLMSQSDKTKLDKYASKGSSVKGVYIDANGAPQNMTYELNADVPANFAPATAAPLMDGTAAVGTSAKYAREDHCHPVDTSRASAADVDAIKTLLQSVAFYRTASGNPATFSDARAANILSLAITLTPTQSGSGDPSPDNVRPILGVSSVTVTRTGQNGANAQSVTVALTDGANPLTVYGGTLDVTTGTLTVTRKILTTSAFTFVPNTGESAGGLRWSDHFPASDDAPLIPAGATYCVDAMSNMLPLEQSGGWTASYPNFTVGASRIRVYNACANNAEFQSQYAGLQIVYPLAAPVAYQLTPQQLATLAGYNSVSADSGSVTVEYRADVALSLDALESNLTNAILSLGAGF